MDAINGGAATVWHNQQQLEAEARLLHQQAQRLSKQSAAWVQTYSGFHEALKITLTHHGTLHDMECCAQQLTTCLLTYSHFQNI